MKTIKKLPTQKYLKSILEYNHKTGEFRWKWRNDINQNKRFYGKIAGNKQKKCIRIQIRSVFYVAHRLAWAYIHGDILTTEIQIDHKNGNPFDNRISNLRIASHGENRANSKVSKNNKLKLKGVRLIRHSGNYEARIRVGGILINLGCYATPEAAHIAYHKAAIKYKGHFARAK